MKSTLAILTGVILASPAYAAAKVPFGINCNDTADVWVVFNSNSATFLGAKEELDKAIKEIVAYANKQQIHKLVLISESYNQNSEVVNYVSGKAQPLNYELKANFHMNMESEDSIAKLGEFLTQQKYVISMNVIMNSDPRCPKGSVESQ